MRGLLAAVVLVLGFACAPAALGAPPHVAIQAASVSGGAPLRLTLSAAGDPATYAWDFGDGSSGAGQIVEHTWPRPGAYQVRVTATTATGESAVASTTVTAYGLSLTGPRAGRYGRRIVLRGRLFPAPPARDVVTLLAEGTPVARAVLGANGRFRIKPRLALPGPYAVDWAGIRSRELVVRVRPLVLVRLTGRRLVGRALTATVDVRPRAAGEVRLRLVRNGRVVLRRTLLPPARLRLDTAAAAALDLRLAVPARSGYLGVIRRLRVGLRLPHLRLGSKGPAVRVVEGALREHRYALKGVDGLFAYDTYEALLAVQKAYGLPRTGVADAQTWRALRDRGTPAPRYLSGTHLEVDKGRQLLFDVRRGRLVRVIHVSTGATGNTPVGRWSVYRKVPGWDWILWYPMYFLRGFAVHGFPSVPTYPASHGCVRVPMWIAPSLYAAYPYGSAIYVY